MSTAISIKNVTKKFDTFTLDHISLDIPRGTIVGLVGENGAGKTTLIKCILELLHLDEGEILIEGTSLQNLPGDWKKDVGVILAGVGYAGTMSAANMGKCMEKIYDNWEKDTFENYLRQFKIDPHKKIKDYSKGMQMKLNLAIALSHQARILIFDEATSGLDPVVRDDILNILLDFIQDENHTVLLSSHIIGDLERAADYIAFLHEGKLQFYMNKDEMLYQYGVVHCRQEEVSKIPSELVLGVRRNMFGCDVLVKDRRLAALRQPELVIDETNIEEIILFLVKGERV